jgi:hypothetical protein
MGRTTERAIGCTRASQVRVGRGCVAFERCKKRDGRKGGRRAFRALRSGLRGRRSRRCPSVETLGVHAFAGICQLLPDEFANRMDHSL